ncbi:SDR family NAD(P)-dependent oxidoreductase (plasmid) [Sinorhizobium sp. B11]
MANNQFDMRNPLDQYPQPEFPQQPQPVPGLASKMQPVPDHGETSYKGSGRLAGRKALVTGGDSGIGRAAAIAFAREGADVVINYLPQEQSDADEVISLIEAEGRRAIIDRRIELSDEEWRRWANELTYDGPFKGDLVRCALSLKFLVYSKTGTIAAAATSGVPERIGGDKNYDYRYAWVRDAAYTIKALLRAGALQEPMGAFGWLVRTIAGDGPEPKVVYTLSGGEVPRERMVNVPGYKGSTPVRIGNRARAQTQLSCYGDVLETAALFARSGHVLDPQAARLLENLAEQCVRRWRKKDCGIWELQDKQHYTFSKIGCWLALTNAADLTKEGHIGGDANRWLSESRRIRNWIDSHCWSQEKQAYTFYAGSDRLDAALLLTTRFGFEHDDRLKRTRDAIERELAVGPLVYRYNGVDKEEGAFVACSCWLVEAYAFLGEVDLAEAMLKTLLERLGNNFGILNEMVDPATGAGLGNLPQGLSHLALLHAIYSLQENRP